ncbi:MAG: polyprenol monophosphomannose synthase [Sphingomonadales bacterium]|nr:polyprenol monophosphomannose synthase [Sphingomonadales bacterium]
MSSDSLVIIPTYNEKENIEAMLDKVFSLTPNFDVLVVDDGSPDGTAGLVKGKMAQYAHRLHILERSDKQGLGTAYIAAFRWALERSYEYIFEMDCDFSHNPDDLSRLRTACIAGADMAIGSRYISGINVVNWPLSRVLLSVFASWYVRFITGMPVNDATAGFKCYRRRVLQSIDLNEIKFVGYAFQIEMKFKAWFYGFRVEEVTIIFTDRTLGQSKMTRGIVKEAAFGVLKLKWWSLRAKGRGLRREIKSGNDTLL